MFNETLDLSPNEPEKENKVDPNTSNDFEFTRKNLYETLEIAKKALKDMEDIAYSSQHPKSYEVLNQMLKTMADINRDLIKLQIDQNKAEEKKSQERKVEELPSNVTNNNLFVGSTAELAKMLENMKTSQ